MPMRCSIPHFPKQEVEMNSPLRWTSALRTLGACVALTCACALLAAAQTTGTVKGTVTDAATQRPLDGAQISVVGTDLGTLTDAANAQDHLAEWHVELILPGRVGERAEVGQVILRIRRVGYGSSNKAVTVTPDAPATADFAMPQVVIGLDAVVVTGTG